MKSVFPIDHDGIPLSIGDYVKYDNVTWEIVDHEDSEHALANDDYTENATLLLAPRSCDGENRWVEDYDVEITEYHQSYFEL